MDIRAVKFRGSHEWMVGGLYSPSLSGRHPAVLCLHGVPGVQKHEDIATELCRRGFVVFLPNSRGSWGSEGTFSVSGLLEDTITAFRLLSRYPHVDSQKIGVIGFSLGGWVALRLAASMPISTVVAIAPAVDGRISKLQEIYLQKNGKVLNIPNSKKVLKDYSEALQSVPPRQYMPQIYPRPLLLLQGLKDNIVPPESTLRLWSLAKDPKELFEFVDEGHECQNNRAEVIRIICRWFEEKLLPAPLLKS